VHHLPIAQDVLLAASKTNAKKKMNIEKAINLLLEYNVPEHIINHSFQVTKVAYVIAKELTDAGVPLNNGLILTSALLHDITKYRSILNKSEDHAETGGELLRKLGYPDIAEIIENHIILRDNGYLFFEKMIVFYSDKRVKHVEIVSLRERYRDLTERYGKTLKSKILIKEGYRRAKKIEEKIFCNLKIKPSILKFLNNITEEANL
jgi:putative nucleotidyltransferase with HDIG domain